MELIDT